MKILTSAALLAVLFSSPVVLSSAVENCNGTFKGDEYVITSPNYYSTSWPDFNKWDCVYYLQGDVSGNCEQNFVVKFLDFDLHDSVNCKLHYLKIGDRNYYCGKADDRERKFVANRGILKMTYHRVRNDFSKGFRIHVNTLPCEPRIDPNNDRSPENVIDTRSPKAMGQAIHSVKSNNYNSANSAEPLPNSANDIDPWSYGQGVYKSTTHKPTVYRQQINFNDPPSSVKDEGKMTSYVFLPSEETTTESKSKMRNASPKAYTPYPTANGNQEKNPSSASQRQTGFGYSEPQIGVVEDVPVTYGGIHSSSQYQFNGQNYGGYRGNNAYDNNNNYQHGNDATHTLNSGGYNDVYSPFNNVDNRPISSNDYEGMPIGGNQYGSLGNRPSSLSNYNEYNLGGVSPGYSSNSFRPGVPSGTYNPGLTSNDPYNPYNAFGQGLLSGSFQGETGLTGMFLDGLKQTVNQNPMYKYPGYAWNNDLVGGSGSTCCRVPTGRRISIVSPNFLQRNFNSAPYSCKYVIRKLSPRVCNLRLKFRYFNFGADADPFCSTTGFSLAKDHNYCGCVRPGHEVDVSIRDKEYATFTVSYNGGYRDVYTGFLIDVIQTDCNYNNYRPSVFNIRREDSEVVGNATAPLNRTTHTYNGSGEIANSRSKRSVGGLISSAFQALFAPRMQKRFFVEGPNCQLRLAQEFEEAKREVQGRNLVCDRYGFGYGGSYFGDSSSSGIRNFGDYGSFGSFGSPGSLCVDTNLKKCPR